MRCAQRTQSRDLRDFEEDSHYSSIHPQVVFAGAAEVSSCNLSLASHGMDAMSLGRHGCNGSETLERSGFLDQWNGWIIYLQCPHSLNPFIRPPQ